jgi:hypothetical protein
MAKKKTEEIVSYLQVPLHRSVMEAGLEAVHNMLDEEYQLKLPVHHLAKCTSLQECITAAATTALTAELNGVYWYYALKHPKLEKIFEAEISAAKVERARKEKEEAAAEKVRRAEELKNSQTLLVDVKDAQKARAILGAAGIKVSA